MEKLKKLNMIAMFFSLLLTSAQIFAQATEKVDVNINTDTSTTWYASPWIWAVGIAVFIIIIVALTRNNRSDA